MKLKKCPICKIMVPEKVDTCPVCGTKYTRFQYFMINNLSKCILILLAILIVYNIIIIISFNRMTRKYIDEQPTNIQVVEELKSEYEKLNFIQKYFVHYSEIQRIEDSVIDEKKIIEVEGYTCNIRFNDGNKTGEYSGDLYKDMPNGNGVFSYYLDDGSSVTYSGEFSDGEITGFGTMRFEDGSKYVGEFDRGILDGYAMIYNAQEVMIKKGNFVSGKLNGMGTIYDDYGTEIYSGRFILDVPTERDYIESCTEATFAQLEANTDAYVNKNLKITGVITEIAIQDDMTVYYVINIAGNTHKNICIEYIGNEIVYLRQGNKMNFYGYCSGYRQYMSSSGVVNGGMIIKTYFAE